MACRRTRRTAGPDLSRTTVARAIAIAEQLRYECSVLLDLYRKRESFTSDVPVADGSLVSVPPPSSQLDSRDKLWRLHSALLQCYVLLERAIAKEEEELGGSKLDYETQRKMVKERLSLLIINTRELLKAVDGTVQTPTVAELELVVPTAVFELKLWLYRVFQEVDYWIKMTITTLKALPPDLFKDNVRSRRSSRNARR
ncbi:ciliary neurotrophic factor [Takifugu flavidus]|uniref:Uncharacterized protein n=1 Tax=Takifugu flavidus TaxID=433684 RepID=A0A5C6MZ14_9TELE|nr:ciliary neurotrophic factor [Takifugu flavidus]TWW59331.1 hypothetical protein D4764_06G0008610 [Takifugu flavidus]